MWVPKRTKQEWKEEKRPTKLLQINGRKPWLIQQIKDYTISRNQTIPIIKEHQSRRERGRDSAFCTILGKISKKHQLRSRTLGRNIV